MLNINSMHDLNYNYACMTSSRARQHEGQPANITRSQRTSTCSHHLGSRFSKEERKKV
jgi:hypothetical protein